MGNLCSRLCQSAEQKDKKQEIHIHSTNKNKKVNKSAKRRDSHEEINQESELYKDNKLKSKKNVKAIKILDCDAEQTSDDQNNLKQTKIKCEIKELALRSAKLYYEKIGLQSTKLSALRNIYDKLGQLDYEGKIDTNELEERIRNTRDGFKQIYIGELRHGTDFREGAGICVYSDGVIIEGCWKDDMPNGSCRIIWPDGAYYIGNLKDSQAQGQGEEHYSNRDVYIGQFDQSKKHGKGEYRWADGRVYNCNWINNKPNGQCIITYPDGKKYLEQCIDGMF